MKKIFCGIILVWSSLSQAFIGCGTSYNQGLCHLYIYSTSSEYTVGIYYTGSNAKCEDLCNKLFQKGGVGLSGVSDDEREHDDTP